MLAVLVGVPRPRLEPRAGVAARARGRGGSRSRRSAWRSAAWRARSGPRRCSRSCSRCRSPRWRWCRRARSARALYDVIRIVSGAFPFKPALHALDAALNGGALLAPLAHLAGADGRLRLLARLALRRFAYGSVAAASRFTRRRPRDQASKLQACSPPPACAACARPACCAAWCGRPSSRPAHLVYPMFVRARRRRPRADREHAGHRPPLDRRRRRGGRRGRRARHPRRAAVRPAGGQGRGGLRRVGRRGHRPARDARDQGGAPRPARDHRPVPVRVHDARPLRRAARRRRRRQRPRRSSCSRARRSRRPRPAPTSSRRAT